MQIRAATERDCVRLAAMLRRMVEALSDLGHRRASADPSVWSAMEDELRHDVVREDACILVLEQSREPIAFVRAQVTTPHPVFESLRILHVSDLYVEPSHRRAGYGRGLVEACLEWGRHQGCEHAQLNVLRDSPAVALYLELGFAPAELRMTRRL